MKASDFDYALPPEQIAQAPLPRRDDARLLVLDRQSGPGALPRHHGVRDLPELLPEGALLIVNDTRVIPARLRGTKPTGGRCELLLVDPLPSPDGRAHWRCLSGSSKPMRLGPLTLDGDRPPAAEVLRVSDGTIDVAFATDEPGGFDAALERIGEVPLPPYIRREQPEKTDRARYQTLFARAPGAVAAPTAGLHFTPELMASLEARSIRRATVTLHVGPGTFAPLRADDVTDLQLHAERYEVPPETRDAFAAARAAGRPVIAVGTTVVRTLETAIDDAGQLRVGAGETRLFVRPGHRFRAVDLLLTNFHLPRSTLLMLVAAFADPGGRERVLAAYAEAVRAGYRFYSYGDAMLVR